MSIVDVPVGEKFVAIFINEEGKEDYIAVECVATDFDRECSKCALHLKGCSKYCCVATTRRDCTSVYFKEINLRSMPLEKADENECVSDEDVSEETAIAENKVSGNDCAENKSSVMLEDISLDKVKALREVIEELFELTDFRRRCGDATDIYRVKFYNLSGEMQAVLPSLLNKSFFEFIDKQLPIAIDKSVKELKNLLNEM
jgi:hypothetical protein